MPSGNFKGSKRRSKKSEKWNEKEYYINKFAKGVEYWKKNTEINQFPYT